MVATFRDKSDRVCREVEVFDAGDQHRPLAAGVACRTLTERLAAAALSRVSSVRGVFHALTAVIIATAFVVPATSARAAMLLPVYLALAGTLKSPAVVKGLSLLFPSVILLSACGVLTGAGAHLVALDLLGNVQSTPQIGYLRWLELNLPIALLSSFAATETILFLFVGHEASERVTLKASDDADSPLDARQRFVAVLMLATVGLWMTSPWHGAPLAIVGLGAALIATRVAWSGVTLKTAIRAVEWQLVLFFAATVMLGQAMLTSGAGSWMANHLVAALPASVTQSTPVLVAFVSIVALLSHLLIVSRTARAAILVPAFALPLANLGYSPAALVMLTVVGTGFCQTLPVSAKPVALFAGAGDGGYQPSDLSRLALALFPILLALLMLFALVIWPHMGLTVTAGEYDNASVVVCAEVLNDDLQKQGKAPCRLPY